jgi:CRP-like cAMP-binding protein
MDQDPEFRKRIECVLSTEIHNYLQKFEMLGSLPAETRLKHLLLELMTAQSESISRKPFTLEMAIRHLEMGEIIGITAEHLSRLLKKMENEHLIQRIGNKLTILDPANLIASTLG